MKHYKIFENQAGRREAVKQGWSWPAFFFTSIWAFTKRMYVAGILLLAAGIALGLLSLRADELFALGDQSARSYAHYSDLLGWIIIVVLGVNGNALREHYLLKRGYALRRTVEADSPEQALAATDQP